MDGTENTVPNISFIVTCIFVAVGTCSTICCLAMLVWGGHKDIQTAISHSLLSLNKKILKKGMQGVLGKTNRLLYLAMTQTTQKITHPTIKLLYVYLLL
jgi:hypothetical protein